MRQRSLATAVMTFVAFVFIYPFAWMLMACFKTRREIYRPQQFLPDSFDPHYFHELFTTDSIPFVSAYLNSLMVSSAQAVGAVVVASMTGFVLARQRFRGRHLLLLLALLVILIPRQVMVLPLTDWLIDLQLNDTLWAVILPGFISGIGILFFREIFRKVPGEYIEIARMEGASDWRVYLTLLPMISSALLTYGLIHFILAWHEHLIPLMVLDSAESQTLPLVLSRINSSISHTPKALVMAGSTLTLLPTAILFALLYRQFRNSMRDLLHP